MSNARLVTVSAGAALLCGCFSLSNDDECGNEFVGGGTYTLELSGGLEARIEGEGATKSAISAWVDGGGWADLVGRYQASGATIALLGRPIDTDPTAGFISSQEIAPGTIVGCEEAVFIASFVGVEFRRLDLLDASGQPLIQLEQGVEGAYEWSSYADTTEGSQRVEYPSGGCAEEPFVVEAAWNMNPAVSVMTNVQPCDTGWFAGG